MDSTNQKGKVEFSMMLKLCWPASSKRLQCGARADGTDHLPGLDPPLTIVGSRRSHSPSDSKDLQELRLYKEQAEASKKAAQEAERQLQEKMRREQELKDLEEKMMKILPMHFRNPKEGKKEARDPADNSEISRVGMKAIEWMLDKQVDLTDVSTWQGVEYKLTHLESHSLRDLQASKVSETNIPRSKAQRVNAIMDFLTREMKH
jgi:hypothetical protein